MAEAVQSFNAPLVGRRVGHYQITGQLGAGGMGIVYKASDLKLGRTVALKFLPPGIASGRRERQRFLREAKAASGLDHPNIGAIHAVEETGDGQLYIVMPCYDGETLEGRIRRGPLPPAEAAGIAAQVADGLAAAHARNIVHCDVKPSNVIVTREGVAKVVDFGLAFVSGSAATTRTAAIAGTAPYMSPEQALGKVVDRRSDIWSLGVVLSEMVTGKRPFSGDNVPATILAVVNAPPQGVEAAPPLLRRVIWRALAKDPAERYQDVREMWADLQAAVATPGLAAGGRGVGRYARQAARHPRARARRRWAAVLAVLLAAAALALLPGVRERVAARFRPPPADRVAVLPLAGLGRDAPAEALSEGLMETLTDRIAEFEGGRLWVVPASEVRRRKVEDAASAWREFGANLVLAGTVQKSGGGLRLSLRLTDARQVRQLGSAAVEEPGGDLAALQDAAVTRIAQLLAIDPRRVRTGSAAAVAPASYEAYLRGVGYLRRYDKPGNLDAAVAAFEEARAGDPKSALALAGLAEAYWSKYRLDKNTAWIDRALDYGGRAAALNDQLASVHVTLGRIHDGTGKHELAQQEFQRALELDARNPDALLGMATAYENLGRAADAEAAFRRAAALRPDYWDGYNKLGLFLSRQRRFTAALPQFRRALELTPDNYAVWVNLGAAYERMERFSEAEAAYRRSLELSPSYAAYTNLGNIYRAQGNYRGAVETYTRALQLNGTDFRVWSNLGGTWRWIGEHTQAREAYARALPLAENAARLRPQDAELQAGVAALYSLLGMRDKALPRIEAALALAADDPAVLIRAAETYESLGDRDRALEFTRRHLQKGGSADRLRRDPELRGVVADPRMRWK